MFFRCATLRESVRSQGFRVKVGTCETCRSYFLYPFRCPRPSPPLSISPFVQQRGPDTQTPLEYLRHAVAPVRDAYNGFNLVVGDLKAGEFAYVGNRGAAAAASPLTLSSTSGVEGGVGVNSDDCGSGGVVYGLSNATLDTPWPKVEVGKARLREEMTRMASIKSAVPDLDATRVIERVLGNTGEWVEWEPEPGDGARGEGGTTGSSTPPPLHESWSTFVKPGAAPGRKGYGTRCSTVRARVVDSRDEELRRHDASGARLRTSITVDTWKRNLYMLLNLTICRACLYGEVIAVKRGGVGEGVGRGEVEMTERVLDCGSRKWRDAKTRFTIY